MHCNCNAVLHGHILLVAVSGITAPLWGAAYACGGRLPEVVHLCRAAAETTRDYATCHSQAVLAHRRYSVNGRMGRCLLAHTPCKGRAHCSMMPCCGRWQRRPVSQSPRSHVVPDALSHPVMLTLRLGGLHCGTVCTLQQWCISHLTCVIPLARMLQPRTSEHCIAVQISIQHCMLHSSGVCHA
jgi:hypothetical protein